MISLFKRVIFICAMATYLWSCNEDILDWYAPPSEEETPKEVVEEKETKDAAEEKAPEEVMEEEPQEEEEPMPEKNIIVPSEELVGTWEQVFDPGKIYFAKTTHQITFSEDDSFSMYIHGYSDAVNSEDTCGMSFEHYTVGEVLYEDPLISEVAHESSDAIMLFDGMYTNETYVGEPSACSPQGEYKKLFSVNPLSGDTLTINFRVSSTYQRTINFARIQE